MSARHSPLTKSTAFWGLLVLSVLAVAGGLALTLPRISTMDVALTTGTITTGTEVYVGQSWVVFGSAVTGAGIIGILLWLSLAAASTFVGTPAAAAAEPTPNATPTSADSALRDETAAPHGAPEAADPAVQFDDVQAGASQQRR